MPADQNNPDHVCHDPFGLYRNVFDVQVDCQLKGVNIVQLLVAYSVRVVQIQFQKAFL
jgi:hypothetical protein